MVWAAVDSRSANSLVLGSAKGESAPNNFIDDSTLLFATNAGSNDISVFQVNGAGLELVDVEPSNGMKPVSITVHDGIVYVLNNDETDRRVGRGIELSRGCQSFGHWFPGERRRRSDAHTRFDTCAERWHGIRVRSGVVQSARHRSGRDPAHRQAGRSGGR